MISTYIAFCLHYKLEYISPKTATICMYAEFLTRSFSSPTAIRNYISATRLLHKYLGIHNCPALHSFELDLIIRAINITLRHTPNRRLPIDARMLRQLSILCDNLGPLGATLKVSFLFGYYAFLRQSNLAPRTARLFDLTRHTCRGDVLINPPGLILILKWSKTIQHGKAPHLIPLPAIPGNPLCPYQAYMDMLATCPTRSPNDPLLQIQGRHNNRTILTTAHLSQAFQVMVQALGYPPDSYSLHSLRAGGASAAFRAGVNYIHIKRHGTWTSDCFWQYIATDTSPSSHVAEALAATATITD